MQKSELDCIFDSFVYNDLRICGDPIRQKRIWVDGVGPEVGEFEEDIGFFLENSETLFEKPDELDQGRRKYLKSIKTLYDMIEHFYHNIVYKHPNEKIEYFIQLPEWKEIQYLANKMYREIKEALSLADL